MITKFVNMIIFIAVPTFLILNLLVFNFSEVNGIKFDPVPFENIPIAKISSDNGKYEIGADFSVDFGDETAIKKDNNSKIAKNMLLNKHDKGISLKLECDSNDICGTTLAPLYIEVYLVSRDIRYEQILNNSIPTLELAYNDCGTRSIKNCADFDFSIPSNILAQNYNIVINMSFDEAEWISINPVKIIK